MNWNPTKSNIFDNLASADQIWIDMMIVENIQFDFHVAHWICLVFFNSNAFNCSQTDSELFMTSIFRIKKYDNFQLYKTRTCLQFYILHNNLDEKFKTIKYFDSIQMWQLKILDWYSRLGPDSNDIWGLDQRYCFQ